MALLKGGLFWLVALVVGTIAFAYSGVYDVSASSVHNPFIRWLFETTRENSVAQLAATVELPELEDFDRVRRGGRAYERMCERCHSAPGQARSPLSRGLSPEPPLFHRMQRQMDPKRIFWVTRNGIRMTGMPAWGLTHSDKEIWDIVAFVQRLPMLSAHEYQTLTAANGEKGGNVHWH